jgi:SAM-dependent methyltransferase
MHNSVLTWVERKITELGIKDASILDVGGRDVNGTCRALFSGPYLSIDVSPGPGVDIVVRASNAPCLLLGREFDVVICTEMLEHDPEPWASLPAMGTMLRPGGALLLTARGNGFPFHGEDGEDGFDDLWRFLPSGIRKMIEIAGCEVLEVSEDPEAPGLFGLGRKK